MRYVTLCKLGIIGGFLLLGISAMAPDGNSWAGALGAFAIVAVFGSAIAAWVLSP